LNTIYSKLKEIKRNNNFESRFDTQFFRRYPRLLTLRVNRGSLWESSKFQIAVALRYVSAT